MPVGGAIAISPLMVPVGVEPVNLTATTESRLRLALYLIRDFPIQEQDNMLAANMRKIAADALAATSAPLPGAVSAG